MRINYYSHVVEFCETKKEGFVSSSFYDLSLVTCVINVSVLIFLFCSHFPFQLKREICEAHEELRALYEELRSSHESLDTIEVDGLEPNSGFKPGCLTTFVKSFREVLEEMVSDNSTKTTVSPFFR